MSIRGKRLAIVGKPLDDPEILIDSDVHEFPPDGYTPLGYQWNKDMNDTVVNDGLSGTFVKYKTDITNAPYGNGLYVAWANSVYSYVHSTTYSSGEWPASGAFDKRNGDSYSRGGWHTHNNIDYTNYSADTTDHPTPAYLAITIPAAIKIGSYSIQARPNCCPDQLPSKWSLYGSHNAQDWTLIHTISDETGWSLAETRTYSVTGTHVYKHFKWVWLRNNGPDESSLHVSTLRIFGNSLNSAWSVSKKLRRTYVGPACRIRRVSDDQELDIPLVGGRIDFNAVRDFCGESLDARVVTVYDQSGSGNDLVQSTPEHQPVLQPVGQLRQLSSPQVLGGEVFSASSESAVSATRGTAAFAFDGDYGTGSTGWWHSSDTPGTTVIDGTSVGGHWLQVQFPQSIRIEKFTISPRSGFSHRMPSTMTLAGSNDGSTWTTLGRFTGLNGYVYGQDTEFDMSSTGGMYTHIRLVAETLISGTSIQITQFKIYGTPLQDLDGSMRMVGGYMTPVSHPANNSLVYLSTTPPEITQDSTKPMDNHDTIYMLPGSVEENPDLGSATIASGGTTDGPWELDGFQVRSSSHYTNAGDTIYYPIEAFNKTLSAAADAWASKRGETYPHWISIEYPQNVYITSYSITSRVAYNGYYVRPPNTWYLQGSDDNSTWTTIDTQDNQAQRLLPGQTTVTYTVSTTKSFQAYRLYILDSLEDSGPYTAYPNEVAIGQFRLFTTPNPGLGKLLAKNTLQTQSRPGQVRVPNQMPVQAVSYQDLVSLISVSRRDLVVNSGKTSITDQSSKQEWDFGGSAGLVLEDGIPCLDLSAGGLTLNGTGATLGREYTLVYYWKPIVGPTIWRTLHRNNGVDHLVIVNTGATDLGMFSNRNGQFRDTGYNITPGIWQTLIVTSVGDTSTSATGTGTFYVNDQNVGTVDRVGSGTQIKTISYIENDGDFQSPGHVAVAGVFNRLLNRKEITKVHRLLERWGQGQYVQKIPKSIGQGALLLTTVRRFIIGVFAFRKVINGYDGPQVRIQRSSDNAVLDIFFDSEGNILTDTTTWASGSSLSIVTWYDQGPYQNHASEYTGTVGFSQSTALFDGSSSLVIAHDPQSMDFSKAQTVSMRLTPSVLNSTRRNPYNQAYGGPGTWTLEGNVGNPGQINYYFGTTGGNSGPYTYIRSSIIGSANETVHVTSIRDQTKNTSAWYINGSLDVTDNAGGYSSTANGTSPIILGDGYAGTYAGLMDFVCIMNRPMVNDEPFLLNLGRSYNGPGALDAIGIYSNAVGVYSLRKMFKEYEGPQVRIRRSSDNVETDIWFDQYGTIYRLYDSLNTITHDYSSWIGASTAFVMTWYDQSTNQLHVSNESYTTQPQMLFGAMGTSAYYVRYDKTSRDNGQYLYSTSSASILDCAQQLQPGFDIISVCTQERVTQPHVLLSFSTTTTGSNEFAIRFYEGRGSCSDSEYGNILNRPYVPDDDSGYSCIYHGDASQYILQYHCQGREGAQNPLLVDINGTIRKTSTQQYQIDAISNINRFGIGTNFDSSFASGDSSGSQWQMAGNVWDCLLFKQLEQEEITALKMKQQEIIGFTV
jgi:hypothetical protein